MFDVLVIGAGHAGCEAAAAAARRGARVGAAHLSRRGCRPDVVQPVDRRGRQGPSGPRARRVRRADGARRRSPRRSTAGCSTAARGRRCGVRGSRPTASSIGAAIAATARRAGGRDASSARRREILLDGGRVAGVRTQRRRHRVPGAGDRDRHVSRRADVRRRGGQSQAGGGASGASIPLARADARHRARPGAAQDRHAAAARRPDDRLGAARGAAERRASLDDVGARRWRRAAAAALRDRPHQRRDARRSSPTISTARRCSPGRSRGGGRAIARRSRTRCGASPTATSHQIFLEPEGLDDPSGLSQRHFDFAAGRRAASVRAQHPGTGAAPRSFGPAMRSNMSLSIRAQLRATLEVARHPRPVPRRADQRHHRL